MVCVFNNNFIMWCWYFRVHTSEYFSVYDVSILLVYYNRVVYNISILCVPVITLVHYNWISDTLSCLHCTLMILLLRILIRCTTVINICYNSQWYKITIQSWSPRYNIVSCLSCFTDNWITITLKQLHLRERERERERGLYYGISLTNSIKWC